MSNPDPNAKKSDFAVADEVTRLLSGIDKPQQERIVRWVAESLGLAASHTAARLGGPNLDPGGTLRTETKGAAGSASSETGRQKDIRSFTEEKKPKSDVQFVAVVGYYHRFLAPERKETIGSEDLQQSARLAGRPVHKTPSVTLNNAVAQGYMDRADRGQYKLNAVGENLVSMALPDATGASALPRRPRKRVVRVSNRASKKGRKPKR